MLLDHVESAMEPVYLGDGAKPGPLTTLTACLPEFAHAALLIIGVAFALFTTAAWWTGLSHVPMLKLYLLLPLLGGLLAITRLRPAHMRTPARETLTYVLFALALVAWGISGVWHVTAVFRSGAVVSFPSLGDFGYVAGGLLWAAGIWIIYEGVTPDFFAEVEANSFLISAMAITTVFVLSVAGGSDLVEAIKVGGNSLQIVALAYPLIYGFNVVMLMRLVHRERGALITHGRKSLMVIVCGLVFLYFAQMGWSTTVIIDQRLAGEPVVIKGVTPTQVLFTISYVVLALGVINYPLRRPRENP